MDSSDQAEDLAAAGSAQDLAAQPAPQEYRPPVLRPGSAEDPLLGRTVGPCRVQALLGQGGMGAVYRAHHIPLDRPVALKVISPEWLGTPAAAETFVREARIAARLEDPRIVQVYDVGVFAEQTYIVMQLVEGETLEARVCRGGALPPAEALRVVKEAALALAAAHRQGVVHRDVKPANFMLGRDGSVRLMDFGLSVMTGRGGPEQDGLSTIGSFDFMAPEQGFGAPPDPRMDLYSLGATYFYALAGRPPFLARKVGDMLLQHREAPAPDVRQFRPEASAAAAALIQRLMAKDPAARPAGALDLRRELESPHMLLDVEGSGSPFRLLPPPPEARPEGFRPEAVAPQPQPAPAAPAAPAPLPAPRTAPAHRPVVARIVLAAATLALLAQLWRGAGRPDWAAAGLFAAGLAAFCAQQVQWRAWARALAAAGACLAAAAACYRFGTGSFAAPAGAPELNAVVFSGLGLVCMSAGFYLGVWALDRRLSGALFLVAGPLLLLGQASPSVLAAQGRLLLASGGAWRWGAAVLLAAAWLALRRRQRLQRPAGKAAPANFNR